MTRLGLLACGDSVPTCTASRSLDNLRQSITRFADRSISYLKQPFDDDAQLFGAFSGRVVLENTCAALLGRLDPFRMLYIAEFQSQGAYEYGKPMRSGFKWQGDVLSEDKPSASIWNHDLDTSKISRALLSIHADQIFWKPAVTVMLDCVSQNGGSLHPDINSIDPDNFTAQMRGRCANLYSTLSKGVHWEFFTDTIVIDEQTIKDNILTCLQTASLLALLSHFVPTAFRQTNSVAAIQTFNDFRGELV